ncbi:MAG: hypothetical protein LBV08_06685 [Clostridiales bacterium]|jgi:hypothetical protein|nr:hypothetical protein [Clostridiales bacterium]
MKKIIILAVTAIIISVCGFIAYRSITKAHSVANISNELVSEKEYKLYLYEEKKRFEETGSVEIWKVDFDDMSAEEIAKQNAFETLCLVKISNIEAKKRNILLTPEDNDKVMLYKNSLSKNVPDEVIRKISLSENEINKISEENALYLKLFESITKNVVVSEGGFTEYFEANYSGGGISQEWLRQQAYSEYVDGQKKIFFDREYNRWRENIDIEINTNLYMDISINDFD